MSGIAGPWTALPTPLTPWILDVIRSQGYDQMTPVQASTIPLFMRHKDVVVEAVTGSGKTLAFVIPILERLIRREQRLRRNEIGALVVSPTRELASQIHSVFSLFLSSQPTTQAADRPGTSDSEPSMHQREIPPALLLVSSDQSSPSQDVQRFLETGADVVVGTPGRVEEFLLGKGKIAVSVKELQVLVLDEADRLLDLGFESKLTRILTHLPKQRRTGLFSATMTDADALSELMRVGLRNPAQVVVRVQSKKLKPGKTTSEVVEDRRIPANLQSYYIECRPCEKLVQLTRLIAQETSEQHASRFIVYFATCACVDYFYRILPSFLPKSAKLFSIHGHLPPVARSRSLSTFSSSPSTPSSPSVLLATDVAARGLDLPLVDVVIQFDPPSDPKAFSHRCGRTARAGRSGRAWVFLVGRETEFVGFLAVRKIPVKEWHYLTVDTAGFVATSERPVDPAVPVYLAKIRETLLKDRALHDKATKAFVSFVRAYSKHEASYIFRTKDLSLVEVAKCFGLLRLPRMPELNGRKPDGWEDAEIDWSSYVYADKTQEAKRLAVTGSAAAAASEKQKQKMKHVDKKLGNVAWSDKATRKDNKQLRREKKDRKRKWVKSRGHAETSSEAALKQHADDDWSELAEEERMAKKLRRGDISQSAFDAEFAQL